MINKIKELINKPVHIKKEKIETHECRIMGLVETYQITLPQGYSYRKAIVHKEVGGACVLPIDKDGNLILETQYRFPVREVILELPAGRMDRGEAFIDCAIRELREETGYISDNIVPQYEYFAQADFSDEKLSTFLAIDAEQKKEQDLDADETVNVIKVPFYITEELIKRNIITDEKTIIGVGLTKLFNNIKTVKEKDIEIKIKEIEDKITADENTLKEEEVDVDYTYPCEFGFIQDHIVKVPNLKNSRRECMYMKKGNFAIPLSKEGRIGIKIKYMPAVEQNCIEFPEKAEFREEYKFEYLGEIATTLGYTNDKQDVYLLKDVEESVDFMWLTMQEIQDLVKEKLIVDGKALAGLLKYILMYNI